MKDGSIGLTFDKIINMITKFRLREINILRKSFHTSFTFNKLWLSKSEASYKVWAAGAGLMPHHFFCLTDMYLLRPTKNISRFYVKAKILKKVILTTSVYGLEIHRVFFTSDTYSDFT